MPLYRPACNVSHQHGQHRTFSPMGSRPREGPAGANLLIYHLPHDLADACISTAFNQFGNVLSAKVYVDSHTGKSKGFGFISYNPVVLAEHAIDQMNGFQIGYKRSKVQHTRVHHNRSSAGGGGGASGEGVGGRGQVFSVPLPPLMPRRYGRRQVETGAKWEEEPTPRTTQQQRQQTEKREGKRGREVGRAAVRLNS